VQKQIPENPEYVFKARKMLKNSKNSRKIPRNRLKHEKSK
jgi:hypothetical protein